MICSGTNGGKNQVDLIVHLNNFANFLPLNLNQNPPFASLV